MQYLKLPVKSLIFFLSLDENKVFIRVKLSKVHTGGQEARM